MLTEYNYLFILLQKFPEDISTGSGSLSAPLWNSCLQWIITTERDAYAHWLVQFTVSICPFFLDPQNKSIHKSVQVVCVISIVKLSDCP